MKLSTVLIFSWAFFTSSVVLAANPNADPRCDGLTGAAFGLCNAATSMGCDDPLSAPNGCDRVADNFTRITGEVAPWTERVCSNNSECSGIELCQKPAGSCDASGTCEERPLACPDVWHPICGCDGNTYGNECVARMGGVSVYYEGECGPFTPPVCGGIAGIQCPIPLVCIDDPSDNCDPAQGGADCGGICVAPL